MTETATAARLDAAFADAGVTGWLHAVDIDAAGLRDLGKPEGFNRRQVEGWAGRWRRARELLQGSGDLPPPDELRDDLVIAWLEANVRLGGSGNICRVKPT